MSATPLSSIPSIENPASPSSDLPSHDNVNTPTSIPMSLAFDTPDLSSGFSYSKSKKKGNWRTLIINANGVLSKTAEIASIINYSSVFSQKVVTRHNCVLSKQPIKSLN